MMTAEELPVHKSIEVHDYETIYKTKSWWKFVSHQEGFGREEVAVYLWRNAEDGWKRKQKYVVRTKAKDEWLETREAIDKYMNTEESDEEGE